MCKLLIFSRDMRESVYQFRWRSWQRIMVRVSNSDSIHWRSYSVRLPNVHLSWFFLSHLFGLSGWHYPHPSILYNPYSIPIDSPFNHLWMDILVRCHHSLFFHFLSFEGLAFDFQINRKTQNKASIDDKIRIRVKRAHRKWIQLTSSMYNLNQIPFEPVSHPQTLCNTKMDLRLKNVIQNRMQ